MSSSAFVPTVLTIPGSTSTSSGEKNYVLATDGNATGLWVASGVTISTSTSTIPDNITRTTSLAISWVSGTTGYARYRFTLDQADYAKKFKIQWDQIYGTAGHWTLQVFSNTAADYSGTSTALTVQTSGIPGVTGTSTTSVDMPGASAPYIEIRIVAANTSATTLYLNAILVGPGTITQGAVISSDTILTSITTQGFNHTSPNVSYRRVGSRIEVQGYWTNGTVDTNQARFTLPLSLTIDGSSIPSGSTQIVGYWQHASVSATFPKRGTILATGGQNYVRFSIDDYTNSTSPLTAQNANAFTQNAISFEINFSLPIAEWSSSGTVNLGAAAQVEYAYNSDVTSTASVTASGFASGPSGVAISSNWSTNTSFTRRVRFQYPTQSDDVVVLELNYIGRGWVPLEQYYPRLRQASNFYGAELQPVSGSTTDYDVAFNIGGYEAANATYGGNGTTWSNLSSSSWRVRKAKASSPVGFGKADSTSFGLVGPRKGQQSLTVTSTISGWNTTRAVGVYYQDQDGNHRLKFNMRGQITSTNSAIAGYVTMSGVTVKSTTNFFQAFNVSTNGSAVAPVTQAITDPSNPSSNHLVLGIQAGTSVSGISISGDIELDSKPSWA